MDPRAPVEKRLVVDLDLTLTRGARNGYADAEPNLAVIERLRTYRKLGFRIAIYTSRNMNTYSNSLGLICANTVPVICRWLETHDVPYDEIWPGKPWCGHDGFYVDDRAIRPSEFVDMTPEQLTTILQAEVA